jgi:hypothetical protein
MDLRAAARRLGRSYFAVRRLVRAGRIAGFDVGAGAIPRYRVTPEALAAFIDAEAKRRAAGPAMKRGAHPEAERRVGTQASRARPPSLVRQDLRQDRGRVARPTALPRAALPSAPPTRPALSSPFPGARYPKVGCCWISRVMRARRSSSPAARCDSRRGRS